MDSGVITALLFNLNDSYTLSPRERRTKGHWVQHGHGTRHKENIRSQQWLWFYIWLIMTLYYKTDLFDTFNTEKDSTDTDNESDNEEVLSKNKQTKN